MVERCDKAPIAAVCDNAVGACGEGPLVRGIRRAVVDDDDLDLRAAKDVPRHRLHDGADGLFLVQRRNHHAQLSRRESPGPLGAADGLF